VLDHLIEEVSRGEPLALKAALHVRHREEDGVHPSGFDLRAQGVEVEAPLDLRRVQDPAPFFRFSTRRSIT
jgi:hypothetical protein